MLGYLARFFRNDAGMAPIEYVLIAAILLVATTFSVSAAGFSLADVVEVVTGG